MRAFSQTFLKLFAIADIRGLKSIAVALIFGISTCLTGIASADTVTYSWTGSIVSVDIDDGTSIYAGTQASDTFSGRITYDPDIANIDGLATSDGDSVIEPGDEWVEYFLGSDIASLTDGTTVAVATEVALSISNDVSIDDPEDQEFVSMVFGRMVPFGSVLDIWGFAIGDGLSELEIAYGSLVNMQDDLSFRPNPPWSPPGSPGDPDNQIAIFIISDVDPTTGEESFFAYGNIALAQVQPNDGAPDVVIFGASHIGPEGDSTLHRIDPNTGEATAVGSGIGFQRVSGLDFHPATGILYATGEREAGDVDVNVLLTINPSTGVGTEIGPTGVVDFEGVGDNLEFFEGIFSDLSFRPSDNMLFGFGFPGNWVATIDLTTGAATQLAFETVTGDRGIEAVDGNGLSFWDSVLVHAGSTSENFEQAPSCSPNCFSALHEIDLATNQATTSVALNFPFVVGFDNADAVPRANGMDFHSASDTLFASVIYGFSGNGTAFLGEIEESGNVILIGETALGMDALAVTSSEHINFIGPLSVIQVDSGGAVYSGVPIGSLFSLEFDLVTGLSTVSDGTTVTPLTAFFDDGSFFDISNDEILDDAGDVALINSLAGTDFSVGDIVDIIEIAGEAVTTGGGIMEAGAGYILDPLAFDDESPDNYPPDPDDVILPFFFIAEEDDQGQDIYSAVGVFGDSDGDGMPDDFELANGFDPNNPDDANEDADSDGLTNLEEFIAGTLPHNPDSDGDSVLDGQDAFPTNPNESVDTDRNGVGNNADPDDDGDGMPDDFELANGLDPLNAADAAADADGDGFTNLEEFLAGTDPQNAADFPAEKSVPIAINVLLGEDEE